MQTLDNHSQYSDSHQQAFTSSCLNILQVLGSLTFDMFKVFGLSSITILHHVNDHCCDTYEVPNARYYPRRVHLMGPAEISGLSKHTELRATLYAHQRFREAIGHNDQFPLLWDSVASVCVTFDEEDFLSLIKTNGHKPMKSISGSHVVRGEGYV